MMLIHKQTKGVLNKFQIDEKYSEATFQFMAPFKLDPDEWWEVLADSEIGRRAEKYYPDFEVLLNQDGNISDIVPTATKRMIEKEEYKALRQKLIEERDFPTTISNTKLFMPTGIFDFIGFSADLNACKKAKS